MKAALELLKNQSLQHGSKRSRALRSPSRSRRSQDEPLVSNGRNPLRPFPVRKNYPVPAASMFDRLEVGSSIAPPLPAHSRRIEARTKKRKDPKSHVKTKEEKERLECYEDDDDENLPFTNYMNAMEISANFRMPLMDKYNGRGDPTDHINTYKMKLQGQSPTVKCRNFHTTLASYAKRWYNKLKLKSIRSWPQLKREFVNAFIGNQTMIADIAQLNDIQQKEEETVKSYFKRFSNVINKIETVIDEKALDALVTGLHMRTPFWKDVQNSQLKTYN